MVIRAVRKYLYFISKNFIRSLEYRSELLLWIVLDILPTLVLLAVWISIFATSPTISGFSLATISQYYLLIAVVSNFTEVHFERVRVEQIREGKIDYFLTRPLPYLMEILLGVIANKLFFILLSAPLLTLLWVGLSQVMPVAPLTVTVPQLIISIGMLLGALSLQIIMGMVIVLLGFWFEGAEGLEHFKFVATAVFAGTIAPPALLPGLLQQAIQVLPFKYLYTVPVSVLQGSYMVTTSDALYLSLLVFLGTIGILWLWRAARFRYSSAGG